jgi:hypothetical protein
MPSLPALAQPLPALLLPFYQIFDPELLDIELGRPVRVLIQPLREGLRVRRILPQRPFEVLVRARGNILPGVLPAPAAARFLAALLLFRHFLEKGRSLRLLRHLLRNIAHWVEGIIFLCVRISALPLHCTHRFLLSAAASASAHTLQFKFKWLSVALSCNIHHEFRLCISINIINSISVVDLFDTLKQCLLVPLVHLQVPHYFEAHFLEMRYSRYRQESWREDQRQLRELFAPQFRHYKSSLEVTRFPYRQLLSLRLVSAIVLDFDMVVQRYVGPVALRTAAVRALRLEKAALPRAAFRSRLRFFGSSV